MKDSEKSKEQLVDELLELRRHVSEMERAEEALRLSEVKYRHLHQSMMDAFASVSMDGFIQEYNEAYCQMLGYEPDEIRKLRYTDITPEKWHSLQAEIIEKQVFARGYSEIYEKEFRRKDGTIFPVELRTCLIRDENGEPTALWAIIRDISERKQAETALRESEERFRQAMEATNDGLWDWNVQTGDVYYSPAYFRMLGYEPSDFANEARSWIDLLHPDDRATAIGKNQACIENRIPNFEVEFRMQTKNREWKTILGRGKAVCRDANGRASRMIGTHVDITQRKQAEEGLQKAKDELEQRVEERTAELVKANQELEIHRIFIQTATQGFGIADLNGSIKYLNPSMCRIMGEERIEDVIGQPIFKYGRTAEYIRDEFLPILLREGQWDREGLMRTRSGKLVPIWHSSFLIRDEEGQPTYIATMLTDITERKKAEDALRQSRDQLQTIYDGMSDGLLMADIETKRFVQANASMCKMLGYSEAELLGRSVKDIHPPESLPFVIEQFHALAEGKLRVSEDVPVLRKDGSVFYAVVSSSNVDNDNRHCVVGFFRDSMERKEAEEALRKSEERFRSYFEQGLMGMALSNRDMQWTDVNDRFCKILGYSKEDALHRKITDCVHPDDLETFCKSYSHVLTGETNHYTAERRYIRKDGKVIYLNIFSKGFSSEEGTVDHVFALFEDISERLNAQQLVRQSHDELRLIYDQMMDGIIIVDAEKTNPVRVNAAYCRMLGYSEREAYSLSPELVHPPEALPKVREHLEEATLGFIHRIENLPFLRKDGGIVYADVVSNPILYQEKPCWISFFHDVTERKKAQEALQREHRTLKHLLQSSDHERQTIAYEIHDGLAQYLAAAIMQFDVAKSQREKKPNEATKAYDAAITLLRQGHSEARRLIAGIRHPVLDEAGVVEAIAHLINEQNREKGPKIEFHSIVDFSRLVPLLENAIYRIIQEGMTNACKYSESSRVRVTLLQHKDRLRIEIRDWGIGFDTTNVKEGSYGLTGIRERARLLGGKYRLQSAAGKGTRITVELPLMERDE